MSKGTGYGLGRKLAKKRTVPCREFMKGMHSIIEFNRKTIQYYAIYNSSSDLWLCQDSLWGDLTDFYGNYKTMSNISTLRDEKAIKEGHIHLVPCGVYILIKIIEHVEHAYMFLDMDATGSFRMIE